MDPIKHAPLRIHDIRSKYKIIDKVGKGTYGTVYKVLNLQDNKYYAIKKFENTEAKLQVQGFPITALRCIFYHHLEISLLKALNHPNIVNLQEIICSKPNKRNLYRGSCFMVFQYMHHDFAGLFRNKVDFTMPEIKCIMKQIIEGCGFLHKNKVMHRDIKSANILMNDHGVVQVADFGLGRRTRFQSIYTYKVVTLWYRAPELLLGCKSYNHKVDVWSIGCVFAELLTGEVLFKKQTEYAIIEKIYEVCGDLDENEYQEDYLKACVYYNDMKHKKPYKKTLEGFIRKLRPDIDSTTISFLQGLLELNPYKRLSCEEALEHEFFKKEPFACEPDEIQKLDVEYHEMFRDRSLKIQRKERKPSLNWSEEEERRKAKKQVKEEEPYKREEKYSKPQYKNDRDRYPEKSYEKPKYQNHRDGDKYEDGRPKYPKRDYPFSDKNRHQESKPRKKYSKSVSRSKSSSSSSSRSKRNNKIRGNRKHDYENVEERQPYIKKSENYETIKVEICISKKDNGNHSYQEKERYRESEKDKRNDNYRKDSVSYKEERIYNDKKNDYKEKERERRSNDRRDSDRRSPNRRDSEYTDRRYENSRGNSRHPKDIYDKSYSKYSPPRDRQKDQGKSKSYAREKHESGEYRSKEEYKSNYHKDDSDRHYSQKKPKEYPSSRKQYLPEKQRNYEDRRQNRSPQRQHHKQRETRQHRHDRQYRHDRDYEKTSYDHHRKDNRGRDDSRGRNQTKHFSAQKQRRQRQRSAQRKKYPSPDPNRKRYDSRDKD